MLRLFRWRYLVPRLTLFLALVVAAQFVLGHMIRRSVVDSSQRSVGAKVEIDGTRLSLIGRELEFRDMQIANPEAPLRNLVEADRCELEFEASSLLHRRLVVKHGSVTGVRFGTARGSSGALSNDAPAGAFATAGWMDEQSADQARAWLERLEKRFDRDWINELASIRLAEEMTARWPQRSSALEERAHQLRGRITRFEERVHKAQTNPLRHASFLERVPEQAAAIQRDVAALSQDLEQLPELLESDRRAIVAARRHDEKLLHDQLAFEKIDANVLTAYLLQKQLAGPVSDVLGWLRWVRRMVPAGTKPVAARSHRRGRNIVFRGCRREPQWVIRSLALEGTLRLGGQTVELAGQANNLSSDPADHDEPIRLRLSTRGSLPLDLQATIDRTGDVARDQLLVDCGGIMIPKLWLGDSDKLSFSIEPTTASLNISLTLEGDRLSGDIQFVQKHAQITPRVSPKLQRLRLNEALEDSLARMNSVATRVSLSGTIDQPRCRFWSNLGPAVAEAVDRAVDKTAHAHAVQVLSVSQQQIDERCAQIDRQIAEQQATLDPQLGDSTDTLGELANFSDDGGRLSLEYLGRRLPENSLFR